MNAVTARVNAYAPNGANGPIYCPECFAEGCRSEDEYATDADIREAKDACRIRPNPPCACANCGANLAVTVSL